MVIERLRRHLAESNYATLGLELVVLVVGILLAFQIDRWGEERRDRELQSTGNLALIRSQSLRRNLANHYASLHHDSRVGLNIGIQQLFEERTAGILTTGELTIIESASWGEELTGVSEARAIEIAEALAARQDALDLLPGIAQHNVFNSKVIDQNRRSALAIIREIESLIAARSK